jgi:hypothetical protein
MVQFHQDLGSYLHIGIKLDIFHVFRCSRPLESLPQTPSYALLGLTLLRAHMVRDFIIDKRVVADDRVGEGRSVAFLELFHAFLDVRDPLN